MYLFNLNQKYQKRFMKWRIKYYQATFYRQNQNYTECIENIYRGLEQKTLIKYTRAAWTQWR